MNKNSDKKDCKSKCGYYERCRSETANNFLRSSGLKQLPRVFDIEQFTEYYQTTYIVCPYYTSRLLINDKQIILCLYNYFIDSCVRNSMQISTNNLIIIIDRCKKNSFDLNSCKTKKHQPTSRYEVIQTVDRIRTALTKRVFKQANFENALSQIQQSSEDLMDVTKNRLIDIIQKSAQLKLHQRSLVKITYPLQIQQ
ncbi:unnamed protein product [Rotaria sp. Silwood1]|nr:unnamed protein product [Rotaria sp. Silwood1]